MSGVTEKEAPQAVQLVLRLIGNLYTMERKWDENEWTDPQLRTALRRRDFTPVLSLLKRVVLKLRERSSPKLYLGKACTYLLGQWEALIVQVQHGQVNLDNITREKFLKRPASEKSRSTLFFPFFAWP